MAPQMILLMRHAEKPADPANPHLSLDGQKRAAALPARLKPLLGGSINFIFAAEQSAHSDRPVETVNPLSQSSGVGIDSTFRDKDYAELANQLRTHRSYSDQRIVVCWHHETIPSFAEALGATDGAYPSHWPSAEFGLILKFEYDGSAATVTQIPGDTPSRNAGEE